MFKTTKVSSEKTVYFKGQHFIVSEKPEIKNKILSIPYIFFNRQKRKWMEDTSYIKDKDFIKSLYDYSSQKNIIKTIPEPILDLVN